MQWNNHGYDTAKWFARRFTHISPVWLQVRWETASGYQYTMHMCIMMVSGSPSGQRAPSTSWLVHMTLTKVRCARVIGGTCRLGWCSLLSTSCFVWANSCKMVPNFQWTSRFSVENDILVAAGALEQKERQTNINMCPAVTFWTWLYMVMQLCLCSWAPGSYHWQMPLVDTHLRACKPWSSLVQERKNCVVSKTSVTWK